MTDRVIFVELFNDRDDRTCFSAVAFPRACAAMIFAHFVLKRAQWMSFLGSCVVQNRERAGCC